jgi:uncharacterized protein (TIGR03083 family)
MTSPPYAELVTAVRREGEGIHSAAALGFDADVPTCEGWEMDDLVSHVARIYLRVAQLVSNRATEDLGKPELPSGDVLDAFTHALDDLVAALQDADSETPVWNWTADEPHLAGFWARRMAHESSVHRYDAQAAHGVVQPIDAELAGDGLDELIDVIAPRVYSRDSVTGPTGTVALNSSDNGSWCLELQPNGLTRLDVLSEPAAAVRGTTSALLLAGYGRVPWTALDSDGDIDLLTTWSKALNF